MKQKSVALNAVINVIRQCCTVLFPLIITRHVTGALGTANYGKVGFGNAMVEYFALLAALGIGAYAVREGAKLRERKEELTVFCSQIFTVNILTTAISYGILAVLLLAWERLRDYRLLILIQSAIILFTTLGTDWINNLFEDFRYIAIRHITFQVLGLVSVFCFVHSTGDYLLYAGIMALSKIGGNVLNIFYIRKKYVRLGLTRHMDLGRHMKPLLFLFGGTMATTVYINFGTTLLTFFQGDAVTGVYSLGVKIYTIVKQLIYAVIFVVMPRLAAYLGSRDENAYQKLLNQLLWGLLLLMLPATVGLYMLSPQIIDLLAGSAYLSGVPALRILSVALIFGVLSYFVLYGVLIPKGLETASLVAPVAGAVANVALNFLLIPAMSLYGAAIAVLCAEALVLLAGLWYSRSHWRMAVSPGQLLPAIPGCAAIVGVCALTQKYLHSTPAIIVVAVAGSVAAYGLILLLLGGKGLRTALRSMKRK